MQLQCPIPLEDYDAVTMAHGGGGRLSQKLIESLFVPALGGSRLDELHDGARLPRPDGAMAMSTDSFVVRPLFFPGGDIGSLSVHGTTNDLAMCGARPRWLSLAFVLEEGLRLKDLWRVVASIREACDALGIEVVTGDTKVVERGKGDGVYVNTTGIGEVVEGIDVAPRRVRPGDRIVVNGPIADHGMTILAQRDGLELEGDLRSDSAALWPLVESCLRPLGADLHCLRDATRGGIASATNEIAQAAGVGIVLDEESIPVREPARAACEIFGLDPLYVANEGRCLAFVAPERCDALLEAWRAQPLGREACVIGDVVDTHPRSVRVRSGLGGTRVLDMLSGEQLPRIC
ncbi:MAG TPA: hydrogenase expression/formation protein HypE [Candidatus Krumholzibacteria bacterium]|nr:hydrogenase expression/formation protein HypE [Candidatus Krumholzibacteria bacterium]